MREHSLWHVQPLGKLGLRESPEAVSSIRKGVDCRVAQVLYLLHKGGAYLHVVPNI